MNKIPLEKTGLVNNLVLDYLHQKPELTPFYNYFNKVEDYGKLIKERNFSADYRVKLHQHLTNQYQESSINIGGSLVQTNINLLLEPNTFTITTGHQLVLAGGPLFVAYKILTAVKLALTLKNNYPQYNFVPVLWLASEDHDFEEISEVFLFNKSFKWNKESNNFPVGTLNVEGLSEVIDEIGKLIDKPELGETWLNNLKSTYLESSTLSTASIKLFDGLFNKLGLVVLDPNSANLKQLLKPVIKQDILEHKSYTVQTVTDTLLNDLGYKTQINARDINFFYLHEVYGRKLIKKSNNGFELADTDIQFSVNEITELIENKPERFSPNVNLRPVYQEIILPNLAYIGGPAEVAYWLQLKSVFETYHVNYPVVVLRFMALFTGKGLEDKLAKFNMGVEDLFGSTKDITSQYLKQNTSFNYSSTMDEVLEKYQLLYDANKNLDAPLAKEFLDAKLQAKKFFDSKRKALNAAVLKGEEMQIEKLNKLKSKLFPNGVFQERIETFMQYEITFNEHLSEFILAELDPFENVNLNLLSR